MEGKELASVGTTPCVGPPKYLIIVKNNISLNQEEKKQKKRNQFIVKISQTYPIVGNPPGQLGIDICRGKGLA